MSKSTSCCWVRILAVTESGTDPSGRVLVRDCELHIRNGGRPPDNVASMAFGKDSRQGQPGTIVWTGVAGYGGRPGADTVFDYGPAFDDPAQAIAWINEPEGKAWDAEGLNRFLMMVGQCSPNAEPLPEFVKSDFDNTELTPKAYLFPESAWTARFGGLHLPRRADAELLVADIEQLKCPTICHDKTHEEWCALVDLQKLQANAEVRGRITRQAQNLRAAIGPVLESSGISSDLLSGPDATQLIAWVADTVEPIIFINKRRHMRARPMHLFEGTLKPMFRGTNGRPDRLHQGHPSYPSGHATMAYVWANLLMRCLPRLKEPLLRNASEIAWNREVAGLHFESDSAAGAKLAHDIVEKMFTDSKQGNPNYAKFLSALSRLGLSPT